MGYPLHLWDYAHLVGFLRLQIAAQQEDIDKINIHQNQHPTNFHVVSFESRDGN
jgi:DNA/RNA-binding domain of Phe-tRNA-synthetase-like protein